MANTENFSLVKIDISIPNKLEVVWGLLKPKFISGKVRKVLVCCFYIPPKSKKKTALIEHLTLTLQSLKTTYPDAGVLISGDRNHLGTDRLLTIDPALKQIVRVPTRGQNILDVILTDLSIFYEDPISVAPIEVDNPNFGVPSDHKGVVVTPLSNSNQEAKKEKNCSNF